MKAPFETDVFEADLEINPANLNAAFIRQAALYAYYGARYSEMMRQEARLKTALEITEAKLDKDLRDRAAAAGTKITENQIKAQITLEPDYIKALNAYNEAKGMTALAFTAVEAFRQRRDMLIQLGANAREEMKGDPSIRQPSEESLAATRRRLLGEA